MVEVPHLPRIMYIMSFTVLKLVLENCKNTQAAIMVDASLEGSMHIRIGGGKADREIVVLCCALCKSLGAAHEHLTASGKL